MELQAPIYLSMIGGMMNHYQRFLLFTMSLHSCTMSTLAIGFYSFSTFLIDLVRALDNHADESEFQVLLVS